MKKILLGHTTPETAWVCDDYPFGFRLRCKIRYWIETAVKGAKKHQMRLMSQTTNPKITSVEVWNKPKGGVYSDMVVMYLDEKGHVQNDAIVYYQGPDKFVQFRADYFDQLDDAGKKRLDTMERASRKINPTSWGEWEAKVASQ